MGFLEKDIEQIKKYELSVDQVDAQLERFKNGFSQLDLDRPCTVGDGIKKLSEEEIQYYSKFYEEHGSEQRVVKFTPASGAATRMFKDLYDFNQNPESTEGLDFIENIKNFAFYEELRSCLENDTFDLTDLLQKRDYSTILKYVLTEKGLNYGALPKALIKFHTLDGNAIASIEEHLTEGAGYAKSDSHKVNLHFTVSPEHQQAVSEYVQSVLRCYESKYNVKYEISYSIQKQSTDTIAADLNNKPFRNADGTLAFRPAGHGALLENLNEIDADVVFVKNIDNVVPDRLKPETVQYKKMLGGILLEIQAKIFNHLQHLENGNMTDEMLAFAENELGISCSENTTPDYLFEKFNRPVRVCAMVQNEGEPGGGPFWVKDEHGGHSLQIVEIAQTTESHKEMLKKATHFNPVDLVLGVKNYKGEKFDLLQSRDIGTGIITQKSQNGKQLKALELPGLWNGSMANWNTIFVEVPLSTFNPVKTVNDLLRPNHQ
ncbi:MAG: NAD metabolism ATPase/kinase [Bacteroidetes bacterium]|nr:MAG: NAD metabolism ATPase/kinase [Bacteroidota bacterium]